MEAIELLKNKFGVSQKYMYELKDVFRIDAYTVLLRVRNSFLPGWHAGIMLHPDLYGPILVRTNRKHVTSWIDFWCI